MDRRCAGAPIQHRVRPDNHETFRVAGHDHPGRRPGRRGRCCSRAVPRSQAGAADDVAQELAEQHESERGEDKPGAGREGRSGTSPMPGRAGPTGGDPDRRIYSQPDQEEN